MYGESGHLRPPSRVIWLEESLLREVRELLATAVGYVGPAFTLIDLDENGLRGAAVDSETGQCLIELNDHTLNGPAFDRAIADHLVRVGKAQMPETAEWARELLELMPQARLLLSSAAGTFLMGKQHVGLLRVTRADLDEALAPSMVRAVSVARSVSIASPIPVTATVVMPNHTGWPGLLEALGAALSGGVPPQMSVIPLKNPSATLRSSKHARAAEGEAGAVPPPQPRPQLPPPEMPTAMVPSPEIPAAPAPIPFAGPPPVPVADRRRQNRLVLVGAALLAVLIVVGGATLVTTPWRDDTTQPQSQRYLTTPDPTGPSVPVTTTPTSTPVVPPINTSAALAPVVRYTTPPPPPPPTTRRPAPRPRQNTIPNPIPGQPPIILPWRG